MAILFAVIALVGWAVGDVFSTIVSRKVGGKSAYFWWSVLGSLISLLYLPFAPKLTDYPMFFVAFFIGAFLSVGTLLYFRGLEIGNASLVGTLGGAYPIVTIPLAILFFAERLNYFQSVGIVCIICGLFFASLKKNAWKEIQTGQVFSDRGVVYGLSAMVIWGIGWTLMKVPIGTIGWYWAGLPGWFFWILLPLFGWVGKNPLSIFSDRKTLVILVVASFFITIGGYAFNIGLSLGYASIVSAVSGLSPVLFVGIAYFVFGDRIDKRQLFGIVISLLGIVMLSLAS